MKILSNITPNIDFNRVKEIARTMDMAYQATAEEVALLKNGMESAFRQMLNLRMEAFASPEEYQAELEYWADRYKAHKKLYKEAVPRLMKFEESEVARG
ncbi:hypothetical protein [Rufibacter quisquiliarum]|uniref:Uncharacterized protein n=1 Tax=Rufibacter quisquiliarum TaxID=1549639 RepID=A0A839GQ97_9BACT|nr:hypothetical protein [Rufibacter quisquiliarum]MBA9078969.1 hypothetical protein [Rufibacter quisquiliarum]